MKKTRNVTFNHNPLLEKGLPVWRGRLLLMSLMGCSLALGLRAVYLQGVNEEFLQAKGESRYARVVELAATRGRVLDRHGDIQAVSTPVKSIWAIPSDARLAPADARKLASLLELDVAELNSRLAANKDFVYLKRQVSPEIGEQVAALKLPGVHEQKEYRRYYPGGEVMAHLLGFTGVEDKGQEGIELAFDKALTGTPGSRRVIKDRRGQVIEDVESIREPLDGRDVTLSVDAKVQYLAHTALKQAIEINKAKAGGVVVLDAKTGEILALVNSPTYNPNNRGGLSGAQLRNRVFTDTYEPGSTMKPFIAGLALDKGRFHFDTVIDTAPGRLTIGNATISDAHRHGALTVAEVIQKSSNIGAAKMALTFSPEEMWKLFDNLGFGAPLKLGFPGEVGGRLRPAKTWRPIEQATMSYGHGISVSLMQMANAYQAFARDGDMVPLTLSKLDAPPLTGRRVYSPQTAREVRAMLEMVVLPGGTATKAQIPGYRVAGKTGTAEKLEGGHYAHKYVASFVGFAPASDPRLIVAVMVDEPGGPFHYGGDVAAPVFAQVMAGSLRALGVTPDAPLAPLQVARQGEVKLTAMRGPM
jgi:cell division protein FtsI (penicillin-binding protein 3)